MSLEEEIRRIIKEEVALQIKELKEDRHAKSQQIYFTKVELAERWGCSERKVHDILKNYGVIAVGRRGKAHTYLLETAENAKNADDRQSFENAMIREKLKAM